MRVMIFQFADCRIDDGAHEFRRGGEVRHLEPQVFDLLLLLVRAGHDLVSYDILMDRIWGGRIVSDSTVAARISAARAAVGDTGKAQAVIRTVPRRGVQLVVPVATDGLSGSMPPPSAPRQVIRMTESADGTGIAWARSGDGPPLLRASHWLSHLELDWTSPVWHPLLDRLGQAHSLIRYDQRGTGLSDRNCGALRLGSFVDDMKAVADAAGLDRFAIFAVSQSVPVAVAFAARYPDRVSGIVLYAGFVRGPLARERPEEAALTNAFLELIRQGWGKSGSVFMKSFSTLFMPDATPEQVEGFIEMQLASASPDHAVALRRAIGGFDVSDLLPAVQAPALVAHARHDAVQPFEQGQLLARGIPDARFIAFDSPNHISLPQDPAWEQLMAATEAFLAEIGA